MTMLRVPITPRDHILGAPDAPVILLEYGDYECPHCGAAHPIVKAVRQHYGDKLCFVFRHFPLTEIHPIAGPAAETAEFAGASGKFWEMHNSIYENQPRLSVPFLLALAAALNLSQVELRDALAKGTYAPKVQTDFIGGVRSGVNGTPTFFINGQRHEGSHAFEDLVSAIDQHLLAHAS